MSEVKDSIDDLIKDMIGGPYHCLGCAILDYCRRYNYFHDYPEPSPCKKVWESWYSEPLEEQ